MQYLKGMQYLKEIHNPLLVSYASLGVLKFLNKWTPAIKLELKKFILKHEITATGLESRSNTVANLLLDNVVIPVWC